MPPPLLEELARRRLPGDGPVELQAFTAGPVNHTYRASRDGRQFSLRVPAPDSKDPGHERQWECRVLHAASAAGLAPPVVLCDPAAGVLVTAWVEGHTWSGADTLLEDNIDLMARLLRRVHALPIPQPARVLTPREWIARYAAPAAQRSGTVPPRVAALEAAAAVRLELLAATASGAPVLCHSDLHRLNLVVAEHATLLDWEYAHVADGFWDLAGWAANNDWRMVDATRLLTAYLGRPARAAEAHRLEAFMWLYDYVCVLWGELDSNRHDGGDEFAVRAERLVERLGSSRG